MKTQISNRSMDLCDSCTHGTKISGYGREIKYCHVLSESPMHTRDGNINFPVQKCSAYDQKGSVSRYEMEEMAIYIEKRKDAPGFKFSKHVGGQEVELK